MIFLSANSAYGVACRIAHHFTVTFGGFAQSFHNRSINSLSGPPSATTKRYCALYCFPGSILHSPPWLGAKHKNGSDGLIRIGCGERKLPG
jgi:hypothetical protein